MSGGVSHPWSSVAVIVPMIIGAVGLIGFAVNEYFVPVPVIPLELIKNRTVTIASLLAWMSGYAAASLSYFLIVYVSSIFLISNISILRQA